MSTLDALTLAPWVNHTTNLIDDDDDDIECHECGGETEYTHDVANGSIHRCTLCGEETLGLNYADDEDDDDFGDADDNDDDEYDDDDDEDDFGDDDDFGDEDDDDLDDDLDDEDDD